jgi:hypothetical protein
MLWAAATVGPATIASAASSGCFQGLKLIVWKKDEKAKVKNDAREIRL